MSHKGRCFRGARRTKARKARQAEQRHSIALAAAAPVRQAWRRPIRPVAMTFPDLSSILTPFRMGSP